MTESSSKQRNYGPMLGNPVFDSPMNPEAGFPEAVLSSGKRGRRRAFETEWLGSNAPKSAIRDYERSAKSMDVRMKQLHG